MGLMMYISANIGKVARASYLHISLLAGCVEDHAISADRQLASVRAKGTVSYISLLIAVTRFRGNSLHSLIQRRID